MGRRNFRQFPSPLELGRSTTTSPALRKSLLAPFTDVEDVPIEEDADGVARPRPPGADEAEKRARERAERVASGTRRRQDEFAGRPRNRFL